MDAKRGSDCNVSSLLYADDIASSEVNLQKLVDVVAEWCVAWMMKC